MSKRRLQLKQVAFDTDPKPTELEVSGPELIAWGIRAKAGEVHLWGMTCVRNRARYVLEILWLDGRRLYQAGDKPQTITEADQPKPEEQREAVAVQQTLL